MKRTGAFSALLKAAGYICLFLACQFAASLISQEFLALILLTKGGSATDFANALNTLFNRNLYPIMLFAYLLFMGICALISREKLPEDIGAKKTSPLALTVGTLYGFGCYPIVLFLVSLLSQIPAVSQSQSTYYDEMQAITAAGGSPVIEILSVCIVGPVLEEILFRGFVQNKLLKAFSPALALTLTGIAFGFVHGNLYQMVYTVPLGIFMSFIAYRLGSIWPSVLMHIAFNSANYLPRIGALFGYNSEDQVYIAIFYAIMLFFPFAFIVASLLYKKHFAKRKEEFPTTFQELKEFIFEEREENMAAPEYIIVGLGNPGAKYERNRHNVGFMALDYLSEKENIPVRNLRFKALVGEGVISGKKVLLMKPQTFMNLSGDAIFEAAAFYKIPPEKILVLFDDISFPCGVFRIREKGSAGGHNGIKSIIARLGSEAFPRVKIGVGAVPEGWDLMHHVLANPVGEDLVKIQNSFEDVRQSAHFFVEDNLPQAGARFNGKQH